MYTYQNDDCACSQDSFLPPNSSPINSLMKFSQTKLSKRANGNI